MTEQRLYNALLAQKLIAEFKKGFAEKAVQKSYQVLSFDLPEHGGRCELFV